MLRSARSRLPNLRRALKTVCSWTARPQRRPEVLPAAVISALGVALYGMFIAIVVPVAKESREVLIVVGAALVFSTAFYYLPVLQEISSGFTIIICTVAAAGIGAVLFPVKEETV